MNLLKNIKRSFSKSSLKTKVALSTFAVSLVALTGLAFAGWTPFRPVYDWNNPADRKGSLNGPRINAFINTPYYGDERAFFDARKPGDATSKDILHNVAQGQKEVILRTYVHNGANQSTNEDGKGVAKNAKVRIDLPTGTSHALRARSYVSISNPAPGYPGEVTDTAELVDARPFSISYVPGSAKIHTAGAANGKTLSDSIVTSGAPIGYNALDGNLPGCFEFQALIEIKVKINVPETDIQKQVKKAGKDGQYGELATIKPGEKVNWLIKQEQKGSAVQNNVRVFDALPKHLEVAPGSVRYIYRDVNGQDQSVAMNDTDLFNKQVDFGTWQPNTFFYIRFDTIAKDDFEGCEVMLTNQARSNTKQNPNEQRDNAQVKIVKEKCVPSADYACDLLSAQIIDRKKRTVKFTAQASASGGASIERYRFNFGDGTEELVTDKSVVTHTYAENGQYAARVSVEVDVNGEQKIAESENCVAVIDFEKQPGAPETLPEAGAGEVIATFVIVTAAGTVAYQVALRRRYQA